MALKCNLTPGLVKAESQFSSGGSTCGGNGLTVAITSIGRLSGRLLYYDSIERRGGQQMARILRDRAQEPTGVTMLPVPAIVAGKHFRRVHRGDQHPFVLCVIKDRRQIHDG